MKEVLFAVGYMPHRLWGNVLQAQMLETNSEVEFYTPREYVQCDESTHAYQRLSPMQKEVVRIIDRYSDRNLHKLFSRKKTAKEFMDTVDPGTIREHVRPFIEKRLSEAFEVIRKMRVPVFTKDKSMRNIFPEDFIRVEAHNAVPLFSFRYQDGLSYSLDLIHGDKRLVLDQHYLEIVSHYPAILLLGASLYFIEDINAKKIRPFLHKDEIHIPRDMESKYFASFVKNTLRDFHTLTEGFEVEEVSPRPGASLTLEVGLNDQATWMLEFDYQGHRIQADSSLERFVDYLGEEAGHGFQRYPRSRPWEEECIGFLKELGLKSRDDIHFHLEGDFHDAISFMNEYGAMLEEEGLQVHHRLDRDYYLGSLQMRLDSTEKEDWFDIRAVVALGEHHIPFLAFKEHILQGIREYELPGGELLVLPAEWFVRYRSLFEFGKPEGDGMLVHRQHFSMMDGSVRSFHAETMERLEKLKEVQALPSLSLPEGLTTPLRPYQVEGYTWLSVLKEYGFGGCLADDMGLGKTLQAIALLLRSKDEGQEASSAPVKQGTGQLSMFSEASQKRQSLVVVPASLLYNWHSECRRFAPTLKVCLHQGLQRNRDLDNFSYYDLIISTYHTVRQDIETLSEYAFHYVILDESQMIKNPSSKLYQAIVDLKSDHRVVLTGTPIENSLTDLWSQINFVNPGLLGNLSFFKRSFVHPIEKKQDEQREEKLKELIRPFILRRTKQEVATELPPVLEQVRYCSMTEEQARAYEEEKSQARNSILENLEEMGLERSSMVVLQALTRLRQIANHPAMLEEMEHLDSGKFMEVCRNVESVVSEGHKVLMFSSFVKHLNLFRTYLEDAGMAYAYLTGSQSQQQRKKAVNDFQKRSSCKVFLISLKAGGVGLNLTAADYVFILDPWWNPASEMQALNRAHRIGQDKNVFVYRFISSDSIEEKIQRLQERKRELAETFVTASNPLRDLDEKELLELFS